MLKFQPKTEDQLKPLLQPGEYAFETLTATAKKSKNGNDMIQILLKVYRGDGTTHLIYDYLMNSVEYKIKHYCDSVGLEEKYNQGFLEEWDFKNKCGIAKVYISKDKEGKYPDRNAVSDYLKQNSNVVSIEKKGIKTEPLEKVEEDKFDDDIPF